jgi:hypothetical protein
LQLIIYKFNIKKINFILNKKKFNFFNLTAIIFLSGFIFVGKIAYINLFSYEYFNEKFNDKNIVRYESKYMAKE